VVYIEVLRAKYEISGLTSARVLCLLIIIAAIGMKKKCGLGLIPSEKGQGRIVLTSPHIIIPDNKAIKSVRSSTGQPDRTELKTALADVPGGSSTTMKATPGELISGINLYSF